MNYKIDETTRGTTQLMELHYIRSYSVSEVFLARTTIIL